MTNPGKKLKELIQRPEILKVPGAYDPLTAMILEKTGFEALFFSGGSASVSGLGYPDIGLMTFTEMTTIARNILTRIQVPMYADGDNGYGNATNVIRTMQEYEAIGLAGIQLDDLILPKKYANPAKQVLSRDEMIGKLKAATSVRKNPDFVLLFRTLSALTDGIEEAVERAKIAEKYGADMIFIDGISSEEELSYIRSEISIPVQINLNEKGFTAKYSAIELEAKGFEVALYPVALLTAASYGLFKVSEEIFNKGTTLDYRDRMTPTIELYNFVGLQSYTDIEQELLPSK